MDRITLMILLGLAGPAVLVSANENEKYFETCTPWAKGARPCPNNGRCIATWDNVNARWKDDASCKPQDYMSIMTSNQGSPPTCKADTDCASGHSCSGTPAACNPVKCGGATPLKDNSGKELFCGRGGSPCPTNSTCDIHPADAWAVCCPVKTKFATCTPWSGGARPCPDKGRCVATWDNTNARWKDDATCKPHDYVAITTSIEGNADSRVLPPRCSEDADCADGRKCAGSPSACEMSCNVDTDCGTSEDPTCAWSCLQGACSEKCNARVPEPGNSVNAARRLSASSSFSAVLLLTTSIIFQRRA